MYKSLKKQWSTLATHVYIKTSDEVDDICEIRKKNIQNNDYLLFKFQ